MERQEVEVTKVSISLPNAVGLILTFWLATIPAILLTALFLWSISVASGRPLF